MENMIDIAELERLVTAAYERRRDQARNFKELGLEPEADQCSHEARCYAVVRLALCGKPEMLRMTAGE